VDLRAEAWFYTSKPNQAETSGFQGDLWGSASEPNESSSNGGRSTRLANGPAEPPGSFSSTGRKQLHGHRERCVVCLLNNVIIDGFANARTLVVIRDSLSSFVILRDGGVLAKQSTYIYIVNPLALYLLRQLTRNRRDLPRKNDVNSTHILSASDFLHCRGACPRERSPPTAHPTVMSTARSHAALIGLACALLFPPHAHSTIFVLQHVLLPGTRGIPFTVAQFRAWKSRLRDGGLFLFSILKKEKSSRLPVVQHLLQYKL
jgi:hypothetical protein